MNTLCYNIQVHNVLLTARPWAERGSRFTLDLFLLLLTARPWAERGSRFTLDLFVFLFFFVSRGLDLHSAVPKIAVNHAT